MGHNFSSEPVVEKDTERDHNDTFNVAVSSCQGWRTSQEDNHTLMLDLPGHHKAAFFAVYDGHGSARVSKHASESLWQHLTGNEAYIKGSFKEALENSFLAFDREVNESYNAQLAGTTAVCVLIVDNVVYCANIGDSRAVASVNCQCFPLSYDHKPENPHELKRILAAGGYVLGNRVNGNLALSRAFGDFHYKGNVQLPADQQIVSPCPDVTDLELTDDVDFLVLACDGIWDVLSSEEVVEFVIARLEQEMEPGLICEELTTRCLATDYELVIGCDNMTVLLICYTRGRTWEEFCEDIHTKNATKPKQITRAKPDSTTEVNQNLDMSSMGVNNSGGPPPSYYSEISDSTRESDNPVLEDSSANAEVPDDNVPEETSTGEQCENNETDAKQDNTEDDMVSHTGCFDQEEQNNGLKQCTSPLETGVSSSEGAEIISKEHTIVLDEVGADPAENLEHDQPDEVLTLNENDDSQTEDKTGGVTLEVHLGSGEEENEDDDEASNDNAENNPTDETGDGEGES